MGVPLAASDERSRCCIQLYHRTATQADLSGKQVLEVSCGHGGGASYVVRTLRPASYTGLDLNTDAIAFCRKRHSTSNRPTLCAVPTRTGETVASLARVHKVSRMTVYRMLAGQR
jgi:hypothetical protein